MNTQSQEARTIYERAEDINKIVGGIIDLVDDLEEKLKTATATVDDITEAFERKEREVEQLNCEIEDLLKKIDRLEADL